MGAVLVTGGAGYVGSAACHVLTTAGRPLVVLDDLSMGHREFVRGGPLVVGDVGDRDLLRRTIRAHQVTAVLHFAAKALVGESVAQPQLYDLWNRGKMDVLVATCVDEGVRAFVFSSSCAVYGSELTRVPIREDEPRRPINPYGVSKRDGEDLLASSGLPYTALRYFNASGALPEQGLGEWHDPETHLIPRAIGAALDGGTLEVYGTDHPTPDGTCIRDYIHVLDLANAHLRALAYLEHGGASGAFNLGTGQGHSVREVVACVARETNASLKVREVAARAGDPPILVADATAARERLGVVMQYSDLSRIVSDAVAFERGRRRQAALPAGPDRPSPAARPRKC